MQVESTALLGHIENSTCFELKFTKVEKQEPIENLLGERLRGSFEMEIRLSDVKKSEPDYIIKGKSSDTLKGQGDVTVQNKSGEVLMTMTREATKKMIQSSFESANISMATGETGYYD